MYGIYPSLPVFPALYDGRVHRGRKARNGE
jgi:hypothetical protein